MKPTLRKTLAVLPLAAACAAFGSAAQAQNAINIGGEVKNISCTASVVGGNTVNLPIAQPSDLPSPNSVAHHTPFTIALTGCGTGANGTVARAMFYNTTAGAVSNGRLNPTFNPTTAGGWQYAFRTVGNAGGNVDVPVRTSDTIVVQTGDSGVPIVNGAANLRYAVRYRRNATGPLTPGKGTASVNYVVYYL